MTPDEAREVLLMLVRYDGAHTRDCSTAMGPPGPFPCDCNLRELILTALNDGKDDSR